MKEIPLTQGQVALVDDEDYEMLSQYRWYASWARNPNTFYAMTTIYVNGVKIELTMHRVILDAPSHMQVDHVNHNGLDNRRINIRLCTNAQNCMNQNKHSNNTSGYKGVDYSKREGKWRARIRVCGTRKGLGYFKTAKEAALAYNEAARRFHGEYAMLNQIGV